MKTEKSHKEEGAPRTIPSHSTTSVQMKDNRAFATAQSHLANAIQCTEDEEEELLQGKFDTAQLTPESEEEELLQGKFSPIQRQESENRTGMPDEVKTQMEDSFGTDFSGVRVHPDSSMAPEVGALAYTQGTDIHFAPGQFKPDTTAGQQLLGHELTHVIQQSEGRVQPTTEVNGMPVNDDVSLETEADIMGQQSAR